VKVNFGKKNEKVLKMANAIIAELCNEIELDLTDLNTVLHANATTLETRLGIKTKKKKKSNSHKNPRWKVKIEKEIESMRSEISILTEMGRIQERENQGN